MALIAPPNKWQSLAHTAQAVTHYEDGTGPYFIGDQTH